MNAKEFKANSEILMKDMNGRDFDYKPPKWRLFFYPQRQSCIFTGICPLIHSQSTPMITVLDAHFFSQPVVFIGSQKQVEGR